MIFIDSIMKVLDSITIWGNELFSFSSLFVLMFVMFRNWAEMWNKVKLKKVTSELGTEKQVQI